uniref:ML domain-containing protein n=1 Tax=Panagrellus redivivus TaxID=6233 RepID=A0A7E4VT57_PANRE
MRCAGLVLIYKPPHASKLLYFSLKSTLSTMFTRFVLAAALVAVTLAADCQLLELADTGSFDAHFDNAVGGSYDASGNPSCHDGSANIQFPGEIKLVSGNLIVKDSANLVGDSKILLTLKKDSWLVGTVCDHGKSKNPLIPDSDCEIPFCETPSDLCTALGTSGTHTLGQLENQAGINSTIPLPEMSSAIKGILKGRWQVTIDIVVGGNTLASVKAPSNENWVNIGY